MYDKDKIKNNLTDENITCLLESLGTKLIKENCMEQIYHSVCCKGDECENHSPKLYYYKSSKSLHCYKCGFSEDVFSLIQQVKNISFPEAIDYVVETCGLTDVQTKRLTPKNIDNWQKDLRPFIKHRRGEVELKHYDDKILNFFEQKYYQGWVDEGIGIEAMKKFEIGYYPLRDEITIPVRDMYGNLVGIRSRALNPETKSKYMPTQMLNGDIYKFSSAGVWYGEYQNAEAIRRHKKVFIVEAEKSVLQLETMYPNNNFSLAMFGKNMSKQKRDWLIEQGVEEVVLATDFDYTEYGDKDYKQYEKELYKLAEWFKGFFDVSVLISYGGHNKKDSSTDRGKEFFEELYKNRESVY